MRAIARAAVAGLLIGCLLPGCAGEGPSAELVSVLPQRTVTSVEVVTASNMDSQMIPRLDGVSHADQIKTVQHRIKGSISAKLRQLPQGRKPTKLVVTLTGVDVASDAGYALGALNPNASKGAAGGASYVQGTAKLVDPKTGAVLGSLGQITVNDQSMLSGGGAGPVGVAIAAAAVMANAAVAADAERSQVLSDKFSDRVIEILGS